MDNVKIWAASWGYAFKNWDLGTWFKKCLQGMLFLHDVATSSDERIVIIRMPGRGRKKVDTGLPNIGAGEIFDELLGDNKLGPPAMMIMAVFALNLIFCALVSSLVVMEALVTTNIVADLGISVFGWAVLCLLSMLTAGSLILLYCGHCLISAAIRASWDITTVDRARLKELESRNADVAGIRPILDQCGTYADLATALAQVRQLAAERELARAG